MVKILAMLGFGIVVFVAAASGSWVLQKKMLTGTGHSSTKAAGQSASTDAHAASGGHGSGAAGHGSETKTAAAHGASGHGASGHGDVAAAVPPATGPVQGILSKGPVNDRLPLPVRPREMSVEELLRYGMGVKEREAQVKQQEELLQKRRVQHQLAQSDIEGERKEIDGLRVQVSDQLQQAEVLIGKLKELRTQFLQDQADAADQMKQIKHERIEIDEDHMDNTKRLSQWIQSMDPEKAAEVLKSMANDGPQQQEVAVQILRNLEEREAAKILSAIDDPKLVQQLIEKFRNLKKPPVKTATKR